MLNKEQKEKLRAAYAAEVWHNDERTTNYCTNKVAALAEFPCGEFIPVEKQKIETRFCFGESGYDYDEAQDAAAYARRSEDYFRRENMSAFEDALESISEQYRLHDPVNPWLPHQILVIAEQPYYSQPAASKLKGLSYFRDTQILEALGGSAFLWEIPGKRIKIWDHPYRIPTLAELTLIREAHEQAAKEHAKKVDAYLKRYGMSKVETWTYWRDA